MKYRQVYCGIGWVMLFSLVLGGMFAVGMAWGKGTRSALAATPPPVIAPDVLRAWESAPETPLRVIVILRTAGNARAAHNAGRSAFVEILQQEYAAAKAPLTEQLTAAQARGAVSALRDLWIIHGLALTASPAFLQQLATAPEVAEIRLDHYEQYLFPDEAQGVERLEPFTPTWGLTQIHAPEVWYTLGVSGTGAVVAVMDTGAEWQHPVLLDNYRGNLGHELVNHIGSWYDAVNEGVYPYDDHGHGTHVTGSAVGRRSIGVAPGAQWISVKVLAGDGYGYDSWIHAGFQWLLAPGGDPALAPAVMNASWSSSQSASNVFEEDVRVLKAAGIMPIFSAGNNGPGSSTLGSPGSLPGAFAVGASDYDDEVAYFSSRGPSPWKEIKPYVVAPGVGVLSSVPGGLYEEYQGTSMAAPHVTGLAALLRSISPTLSITTLTRVLTETAVPLSTTLPNNDNGWGRVDAFAAASALIHPGFISGTVRGAGGGIPRAAVMAAARETGQIAMVNTDAQGHYALALPAGQYVLTATAFGYAPRAANVGVLSDTVQSRDFALTALPVGTLAGQVRLASGAPPTRPVVISVGNTPVTTTVSANGAYRLALPAGIYPLTVRGLGYRVGGAAVIIYEGQTTHRDFNLTPAPTLLLVDEGPWYYGSQIAYWERDLQALGYVYDKVNIKHYPAETPISVTLRAYDIVLWSSPQGSPGLVQGSQALQEYLLGGGHLLLSGQNVAYFDGTLLYSSIIPYLREQLGVRYFADMARSQTLQGMGVFAGLTVTITGGAGANNQSSPDVVGVANAEKAALLWRYTTGEGGGVGASVCVPYRSLFFGFGYEAIADAATRRTVMARSLEWLTQPPLTQGLHLTRLSETPQIGLTGETLTHTLRLRHIGYAGQPEPLAITWSGQQWPTTITPTTAVLSPCTTLTVMVSVTIPPALGMDIRDTLILTVTGLNSGERLTVALQTKTPAPVLLIDDDRWYPMETYYTTALQRQHIPFDVWSTRHESGLPGDYSPSGDKLKSYPLLIWFTGYDWFDPVESDEEESLLAYLRSGGRFLLSSQDFLYNYGGEALIEKLGILKWDETLPKTVMGVPDHPAGGEWGPVELRYPFTNWADGIEPTPGAAAVVRSAEGQPIAIAHNTLAYGEGKTLFYAFPLETLPEETRALALTRAVEWLSPLGDSTWTVTPTTPLPGQTVFNYLTLSNDAAITLPVAFTHTLPISLTLVGAPPAATVVISLPGGLRYDSAVRRLAWAGTLAPGARQPFTWAAIITGTVGAVVVPTVTLTLPEWNLSFTRAVALPLVGGDLAGSHWVSASFSALRVGRPLTLEFVLHNQGSGVAEPGQVQFWLMDGLAPITMTLPPYAGVAVAGWQGELLPGVTQILTVPLRAWDDEARLFRIDALLETSTGQRWERRLWLTAGRLYLPLVLRQS